MNELLQRLHDATNDTERVALLGALSAPELTQLNAALAYHSLMAEASAAAAISDAFTASLASALDDNARLKLIAQARAEHGDEWLAEWSWWRKATQTEASTRWQELVRRG
ncbi:MAG TPA: hypothetical protein VGG63_16415 [Steroidobacteraceae bacterium]|jgi:hypothetical protein